MGQSAAKPRKSKDNLRAAHGNREVATTPFSAALQSMHQLPERPSDGHHELGEGARENLLLGNWRSEKEFVTAASPEGTTGW